MEEGALSFLLQNEGRSSREQNTGGVCPVWNGSRDFDEGRGCIVTTRVLFLDSVPTFSFSPPPAVFYPAGHSLASFLLSASLLNLVNASKMLRDSSRNGERSLKNLLLDTETRTKMKKVFLTGDTWEQSCNIFIATEKLCRALRSGSRMEQRGYCLRLSGKIKLRLTRRSLILGCSCGN